MALSPEQIARAKGLGCLRDKTTEDCFNVRVITRNGKITADESHAIADAATKFGSGEIAMTTRQTIEIQKVPYRNIDELIAYLGELGLEIGGTGPKVRPIVSCKGTTCVFGLIDTYSLSLAIHEKFYRAYHGVKLPHKFKIAVGGCPNNCVKPDLNDIGVIGQSVCEPNYDRCRGCKSCAVEKACPMGAARKREKLSINSEICNNCGRCRTKCPFNVFENSRQGYKILIGGRWGKKFSRGIALRKIFESEAEVLEIIEKSILFFKCYGIKGERFADTVARIGFSQAERIILSEELLLNKEEIINSAVKEG